MISILAQNALYSMAKQTSFQEQYGIYPYEEPENVTHPKGGHFYCESYQKFTDKFILDGTVWSGWKQINGATYYFVDNVAVKGVHKVPGLNDESNEYFYQSMRRPVLARVRSQACSNLTAHGITPSTVWPSLAGGT